MRTFTLVVGSLLVIAMGDAHALSSDGLAAHWPLDEAGGTSATDVSGAGWHGTFASGTWVAGRSGGAISFPDTGGGISIAQEYEFRITGALSLSAWVDIRNADPATPTQMRIVSKKTLWNAPDGYELEYDAFNKRVTLLGGGANFARANAVNLRPGWHHIAATVTGTVGRIYVDGVDVTTDGSIGALAAGTAKLFIARHSGNFAYLQGAIDDVRIYRRALSASEVGELAAPTVAPSGLVGHWRMDENTGTVAADASGRGHHGRLTTTTTINGTLLQGPTWTSGVHGAAVALHGTDKQRIDIGVQPGVDIVQQLAATAWIRVADANDTRDMRVLSKKLVWNAPYGYSFEYSPTRNAITLLGGGANYARATGIHLDTGWHHLAATADGATGQLWVDGINVTTDSTIDPVRGGGAPLYLGLNANGFAPLNGAIDDVRLWAGTVSDLDIRMLASAWPNQTAAGPFTWVRKLHAPAAAQRTTVARDGSIETVDATAAGPNDGALTLDQWSGDNQAGGRSFAGNDLVGAPGLNYFLSVRSFNLREGTDASGTWVYAQKRQQDAQLRFGFIAALPGTLPLGHGLGPDLGGVLPCDAIVVCLPFRHDAKGAAKWQTEYYNGNPPQAGIWQVAAGTTIAQAQITPQNRLSKLKSLKKTAPGNPALSFKLELTGAGGWRFLVDSTGDGVVDEIEVSGNTDNRVSTLTSVTDDNGLLVSVQAAAGSGTSKVGRSTVVLGYRENSGTTAPTGVAALDD